MESPAPDTWKEPRLKPVNRELQQWVKKIRQPGGTRGISRDEDDSDEEANLAVGPLQQFMGNISKISKAIKRKAEPVTPQSVLQTPVVKQSPSTSKKPKFSFKTGSKGKRLLPKTPKKTPSSGYKTLQKKKTLKFRYKTPSPSSSVFSTASEPPLEKSSEELAAELPFTDQVGESPWKSPGELARESIRAIRRRNRKSTSEERKKEGLKQTLLKKAKEKATQKALKKLAPAAGWKPFGTPAKRRLHGKDW